MSGSASPRRSLVPQGPNDGRTAPCNRRKVNGDTVSCFERNATLTRIPLVDSNDPATDPSAADVLKSVSRHRNRTVDPNVYRAMANHPDALRALVDFGTAVYFENSLTPAQRELAYLTASVTNDCHY